MNLFLIVLKTVLYLSGWLKKTVLNEEHYRGKSSILGFHSRDTGHGNGCYPPSLCPSSVNNLRSEET